MRKKKPLYFLNHEGKPDLFSGYGIPFLEGEKSPLVGFLMLDRPKRASEEYIGMLSDVFGLIQIAPIIKNGDRGLYAEMWIEDSVSLGLLREGYGAPIAENIGELLEKSLNAVNLPAAKLKLRWSKKDQLWVSRFYLEHPLIRR